MSKYEIPYFTACIQAFGRRFSMTRQSAFRYLHEHKGLAYNSPLMPALQDEENELYVQSPAYLYEMMKQSGDHGLQ